MINVCEGCGQYRNDKIVDKENSNIICPECGFIKSYKLLPLFVVSGASGSGKSTVCNYLLEKSKNFIVLDMDILWTKHFDNPENNYKEFFETWLRMAKNISQTGLPVVLFGAGCIPNNIKDCIEKRYFSKINYIGLVCRKEELEKRLHNRPKWRKSSNMEFIEKQIEYNNFLNNNQEIKTIETDNMTIEEVSNKIKKWIEEKIEEGNIQKRANCT